ncbi:transposon Ty3-I Gag-Pol polyprotein [Trichonephila inaurata madagascariensis]|uniref:Transposon Ty3-I Gag-Pol polyprotein n=1 Tax=Trichonephila inaurata madagascariensis TaxID=2747483 RepID=A0A8X7C319_9ARAC|nr:transposon Ty3-I Gag-Pol polyprotein [Trichonephila inaurata madagascariensis]
MKLIEGGSDSGSRNFVTPKIFENVVRLVGRHFPSYVESDSSKKITASGYQTRGDINVVLDGSKHLLFEKNIAIPSMVSTYRNGKSDVWVANLQSRNQIIPRGICIGQAEPLNEGHLCVISDTSGGLDDQQETSESQMNCSLMMSPELSDEQINKLSELLRKFSGLFTKTDKRFIKGFCYLAEPLQSLLKNGVVFHWGPEEVEAFNSLKKALTSDPVLGMYDESASTEIHTDASGSPVSKNMTGFPKEFLLAGNVPKFVRYVMHCRVKGKILPQRPPERLFPSPTIAPFHRIGIDPLGKFSQSH